MHRLPNIRSLVGLIYWGVSSIGSVDLTVALLGGDEVTVGHRVGCQIILSLITRFGSQGEGYGSSDMSHSHRVNV